MPLFHQMFILKGICRILRHIPLAEQRELSVLCMLETHISNHHYFLLLFFWAFFHICLIWIALEETSSWTWHLVSICKNKSEVCLRKKEHLTYPSAFFSDTQQVRAETAVNNHNQLHPETSIENIQQCPFLLGFFALPFKKEMVIFGCCYNLFAYFASHKSTFYILFVIINSFSLINISQMYETAQLQQAVVLVAASFQIQLHVDYF